MKIYTRTGDKGYTTLIGGKQVSKAHIRIEVYGTVDELIAHIGMLRDLLEKGNMCELLLTIQGNLMNCAALLASDNANSGMRLNGISDTEIAQLEMSMDEMEATIPPLHSFILPGGNIISSQCQITRTVCRRAERQIVRLSADHFVPDNIIKYMNRLSDFLFVLARSILHDANKQDIPWRPGL
jgi:cob(I)alamin adenosyltransferase